MSEATVDPLLAELQGTQAAIHTEGQNPEMHPAAMAAAAAAEDPLAIPVARPAPLAQKLDKTHATSAGGKGYAVKIKGDFFAAAKDAPGKKILKPYEVVVNVTQLDGALSTIKNKILDVLLRKKYGEDGYLGFRTHEVVEARPLGGAPESNHLAYMTRERLVVHVEENRIPVEPREYANVEDLRAAVVDFTLNPVGFEEREKLRQADRKETAQLLALNPDLNS